MPGRQLDCQHPALATHRDPDRDQRRHRHHPTCLTHLEVRGVEPQVRVRGVTQRPAAERLDLGVERRADAADLALADALDAQGADEVVDTPRGHARHVRLLDHGEQRALGSSPRLQQAREVRAVADSWDRELDGAHAGVPAPIAVPVATGEAALRIPLAMGEAGELGHLGLHHRLGEHPHALAQKILVALGDRLAHRVLARPSCPRPSRCSPCRRLLVQRREDDAVAVSVHGLSAVTPSLGT